MDPRKPLALVADADGALRKQVSGWLQTSSFEVVEAKNGREAMDMAIRFRPELVLLDSSLPLIDGYRVCRYLKKDPSTRGLCIMVMGAEAANLSEAIRAGADDCLPKPMDRGSLASKCAKLLFGRTSLADRGVDRRGERKPAGRLTASWGSKFGRGYQVSFKEPLVDLSAKGMSFDHERCNVCTGYERGGVHPACPFAPYARKLPKGRPLSFVITLPSNKILSVRGKVAHVFQPDETPKTEKVGIVFTKMPRGASRAIREFLEMQGLRPVQ